jgi:hypothetical protein
MLEGPLGRWRFLLIYLVAIAGGSAAAMLLQPSSFSVGASGGVFGLMGAPPARPARRAAIAPFQSQIGQLLLLNLVLTFVFPNVSIGGHLGGLGGGALGYLARAGHPHRLPAAAGYGALGALRRRSRRRGSVVAEAVEPRFSPAPVRRCGRAPGGGAPSCSRALAGCGDKGAPERRATRGARRRRPLRASSASAGRCATRTPARRCRALTHGDAAGRRAPGQPQRLP